MKQTFMIAALALFLAAPARADEVCIPVETGRVMDNGFRVIQVICVSDDRPAPRLRFVEGERSLPAISPKARPIGIYMPQCCTLEYVTPMGAMEQPQ